MATLNEGSLCREALTYWLEKGWIVVAPHSPLLALRGDAFSRDLTLREFCGEQPSAQSGEAPPEPKDSGGRRSEKNDNP